MTQLELDFTTPPEPTMYPEHRVRKTLRHEGSKRRAQHVYIRMTEHSRKKYNQIVGGFKHFMGPHANGADVFERYGLPAMAEALKVLASKSRLSQGANAV